MRFGVLGTGMVGQSIATKLVRLGQEVRMGARNRGNDKAVAWVREAGALASEGSFSEAAAFGEVIFNCTLGGATLEALTAAGAENLRGKVLVDLSNPLDFSKGMPPTLFTGNTDSLGEQIQRAFPEARVVKTLNTINCQLMVDPMKLNGGEHDVFVSGNHTGAKGRVAEILRTFGWKHIIDLGDITTARGTESYLPLWARLWGALQTADFNIKIVR